MSEQAEYIKVVWDQVISAGQLQQDEIVELRARTDDQRYSVRISEERGIQKYRLRVIDNECGLGENVHFDLGVRALVDAGLLYRRLEAELRRYDVWATAYCVWSYRPEHGAGPWYRIGGDTAWVTDIPDDAKLIWRMVED